RTDGMISSAPQPPPNAVGADKLPDAIHYCVGATYDVCVDWTWKGDHFEYVFGGMLFRADVLSFDRESVSVLIATGRGRHWATVVGTLASGGTSIENGSWSDLNGLTGRFRASWRTPVKGVTVNQGLAHTLQLDDLIRQVLPFATVSPIAPSDVAA